MNLSKVLLLIVLLSFCLAKDVCSICGTELQKTVYCDYPSSGGEYYCFKCKIKKVYKNSIPSEQVTTVNMSSASYVITKTGTYNYVDGDFILKGVAK